MSQELADFATRFVEGKVAAETFADEFIDRWKQERDDGRLLQDSSELSERLSTVFCFADLYNPRDDREDYEFDEVTFRTKVQNILSR